VGRGEVGIEQGSRCSFWEDGIPLGARQGDIPSVVSVLDGSLPPGATEGLFGAVAACA
jgi:hypothetical protein